MGERAVDHNPAFKLYLVTRNAAPPLAPDVAPLLTVTNFSITRSGLESECARTRTTFVLDIEHKKCRSRKCRTFSQAQAQLSPRAR